MLIAQVLEKNQTIQTIDISFNNIGGGINESAQTWKKCFKNNKTMIHVDISF